MELSKALRTLNRDVVRPTALVVAALLALLSPRLASAAGAPLDTGGFETYNLAALPGQQGWLSVGSGGTAVVQSSVVQSGSQAVRVDRAAGGFNFDNRWTVPLGTTLPSHRLMIVDWDMLLPGTGLTDTLGPFFGVEAYDDQGVFGLLGSFGVDATTSDVLYQIQDSGVLTETGGTATFGVWHHFRMVFDFTLNQYSGYFNGIKLMTTGFVDRGPSHTNLNQFTDADISALAAGTASPAGSAYYDNFRVLDGIPGDFDFDGDVDVADFPLWQTAFASTAGGDADGDLDSDGADFLIWQQNLGVDLAPAVGAGTSVPEPTAASLTILAAGLVLARRRCSMAG